MNHLQQILTPRVIAQYVLLVIVVPLLPMLISGRWDWWEAWAFVLFCILGFIVSRALAERRHPGLLAERTHILQQEDAKPWDKALVPLVGLGLVLIPLVAGLDARFGWTPPLSLPLRILGLVVFLAADIFGLYALVENRFFSGMVRPQTERGQHVVSSGPYRWVRHPGYAGTLWANLAIPLLLASAWALVPAVLLAILLIIRTRLEDQTLQEELPGYSDYVGQVRYRLFPGIW